MGWSGLRHCAQVLEARRWLDCPGLLDQAGNRRRGAGVATGLLLLRRLGAEGQPEATGLQYSDDDERGYGYVEPRSRSLLRVPFLLGLGLGQWLVATPADVATFGIVGSAVRTVHLVRSPLDSGRHQVIPYCTQPSAGDYSMADTGRQPSLVLAVGVAFAQRPSATAPQ